jgi:hypothetical protein
VTVVSCLHQFCFNCLFTWLVIKENCPVCKATVECIIRNKIISSSSSDGTNEAVDGVDILRLKGNTAILSEKKEDYDRSGDQGNPRKRRVSEDDKEAEEEAEVDFGSLNHQLTRAISCHMSRRRLDGEQRDQAPSRDLEAAAALSGSNPTNSNTHSSLAVPMLLPLTGHEE